MGKRITPREAQVLQLAGSGMSTKRIANKLGLSPRTVDSHLQNSFEKLGVSDRVTACELLGNLYPQYAIPMEESGPRLADRGVEPTPVRDPRDTDTGTRLSAYDLYAQLGKYRSPSGTGISRFSLILRVAGMVLVLLVALAGLLSVFQIFDRGLA